jgi:peptide/nickel transport system ATP-binding protein
LDNILEVNHLVKYYPVRHGLLDSLFRREKLWVKAVDDVSFSVGFNETLGLVGESGSGKTTLGRTILRLERPTSGQVFFKDQDVVKLSGEELRQMRRKIQIVFQNPTTSLDPRQRVKDILSEPLKAFGVEGSDGGYDPVVGALRSVGLPEDSLTRFPHEFSGGQRQRISIARALMLNPEFLVLDEPTSALDSSIQVQILNLLRQIQEERKLSYLFITHNVSVVRYMADRIAVMYSGKIVEVGKSRDVLQKPLHPYTIALIASVPEPDPEKKKVGAQALRGEVPSAIYTPSGCRFHPRCPYAEDICKTQEPALRLVDSDHLVACHFALKIVENPISSK